MNESYAPQLERPVKNAIGVIARNHPDEHTAGPKLRRLAIRSNVHRFLVFQHYRQLIKRSKR